MEFKKLVLQNRTCRRFHQEIPVDLETLRELVDLARLSASAGNRQALKYILVTDPQKNAGVFFCQGRPKVQVESVSPDENIRYWRSSDGTHHVPKRSLAEEIIIGQM